MMDYRKKINEMKVPELIETTGKLKIPRRAELKTKEKLIEAILQCPEKEIKKILGMDWWQKHKKAAFYTGLFCSLAGITALFLTFWFHHSSKVNNTAINKKIGDLERMIQEKIPDPTNAQKVKEEYEIKRASIEETLKYLKTGDKNARDEALKAFKRGDYSKVRKLFEEIQKKEKGKKQEHTQTAYNLGEIAFLELDFKGALTHYLESERLDPKNHEA